MSSGGALIFSPLLKALSGVAVVVGLLTGVGTIVGWIASDSFGDTVFTALRIAGLAYFLLTFAGFAVYCVVGQGISLLARCGGVFTCILISVPILYWGVFKWEDPWFFVISGLLGSLWAIAVAAAWSIEQERAFKRSRMECPDCAETVKSKARVCRHCGYRFHPAPAHPASDSVGHERVA